MPLNSLSSRARGRAFAPPHREASQVAAVALEEEPRRVGERSRGLLVVMRVAVAIEDARALLPRGRGHFARRGPTCGGRGPLPPDRGRRADARAEEVRRDEHPVERRGLAVAKVDTRLVRVGPAVLAKQFFDYLAPGRFGHVAPPCKCTVNEPSARDEHPPHRRGSDNEVTRGKRSDASAQVPDEPAEAERRRRPREEGRHEARQPLARLAKRLAAALDGTDDVGLGREICDEIAGENVTSFS